MVKEDESFLFSSWLIGSYYGCPWFRRIPPEIFYSFYHRIIEGILERPGTEITVACMRDAPDVLAGYAASEKTMHGNALHFVYVKKAWRKMGLAKLIVPRDIQYITHLTDMGKRLKPELWQFNPFLI